jgi:transcription antitermination protein NusB
VSARGKARKRALDILFESEARGLALGETLDARRRAAERDPQEPALNPYTTELVEGVAAHQGRIDEVLGTYAQGWSLERMPAVDRNVLRIGVYELLWREDVPDAVAVSEAVRLVTELSTDESPAFVNGLLARIASVRGSLDQNGGSSDEASAGQ